VRSIKFITVSALSALLVLAGTGCDDSEPTGTAASPAAPAATSAQASPTAAAGANTKKVCTDVDTALRAAQAKIAEAEAIGPPAGHFAVGAAYFAGAAAIDAQLVGATGPVADAGAKVADAMTALGDKYDSPQAKPDKAPLETAISQFRSACA